MPAFFSAPGTIDPHAIEQLTALLHIAEKSNVHLMITGLASFRIKDHMPWYDAMDNEARWKTQELFWDAIAKACAKSPAVFCYDLANEPVATGKKADGWYFGKMGDVEFCQRLTLDDPRPTDVIFSEWTKRMAAAIHRQDANHLITMGMLPFPETYHTAAEHLDFISPHLYPESKKVDASIEMLKKFNFGKPIVIGETFILTCSAEEERGFLLRSRGLSQGWIGHWPDDSPTELAQLKKDGKLTISQAIWLAWVELFKEMGPEMTSRR